MSKSFKGGILLIIAGVFLLLNQAGLIPGQAFLFLLALGFIATYVLLGARKEYGNVGFLIPGVVLLSIAVFASFSGQPGYDDLNPAFFFLGLSLSFLAVFLVAYLLVQITGPWRAFLAGLSGSGLVIIGRYYQFFGAVGRTPEPVELPLDCRFDCSWRLDGLQQYKAKIRHLSAGNFNPWLNL